MRVASPGDPVGRRVEIRCPVPFTYRDNSQHPGKMFMVLFLGPGEPDQAAVIEVPCNLCRKIAGSPVPRRVLHRYNLAGDLIGTVTEHEET